MALILCLETSTTQCSVGLARDGQLIALKEEKSEQYMHSEWLHVFIEQVLEEAGVEVSVLDAVAVGKGPGSYTGLRIGVSAAKGLCFAQNLKLIALPTLDILARQIEAHGVLIPLLDARRMEVYSKVLDSDFRELRATDAEVIDEHSFKAFRGDQTVYLIGPGAEKCREVLGEEGVCYHTETLPSVRQMAAMAQEKYERDEVEDVAYFEPYYLKDFVLQKPKPKI
jgi:tRNA threonylcarbamoyladenosine biosynthesis protein TsaB